MSKQWKIALAAGVILAAGAAIAEADKEKGFYIGGNAFYNDVFDADGNAATTAIGGGGVLGAIPGVGGGVGASNVDFEASFDREFSYGATFGYKFESPYRIEFEYRQGENDVDSLSNDGGSTSNNSTLEVTSMMGNLWYDFSISERLRPYLGFGLGQANLDLGNDDDDVVIGQLGAGLTYYLTPRLAIDAGYRYSVSEDANFTSGASSTELEYSAQSILLGLRYNFFDAKYGFQDRDGDGVSDKMDECLGTPRGVQVDSVGCPLDGDNDGVADYLDQCPNTPAGAEVNVVGCPIDGDNDGVANVDDECPDTLVGEAVMSNGCAKDQAVILRGVNFELNSAKLTMNAETILDNIASTLISSPNFNVELQGHSDDTGSNSYNMNLSQNRAKSVKNYLVGVGVDGSRLTAAGYGEEQSIASNDTKDGRAENRRVELKVLGVDSAMVADPMMSDEPMDAEPMVFEPMVDEAPMADEESMVEDEPMVEEEPMLGDTMTEEPMAEESSEDEMMMDEPASDEEYQPYEMSEDELDY